MVERLFPMFCNCAVSMSVLGRAGADEESKLGRQIPV